MYEEVRSQLSSATELAAPLSTAALQSAGGGRRQAGPKPRVRMFVSLDFEWWEKSSETILEVGWSLWDTATQRHRTRHWIIKENLNKVIVCVCVCIGGSRLGVGGALTQAQAGRAGVAICCLYLVDVGPCAGSRCSQQWVGVEFLRCPLQPHLTLHVSCVCPVCVLQHNGGYISDNRMNFIFGTSERGSLERAFDALQAELDAMGVSDGLTRQQVGGWLAGWRAGWRGV